MSPDTAWHVTLTGPRLRLPAPNDNPWNTVYGYGSFLQVSPTQVAVIVNRRVTGHAVVDFEDGTDALIVDDLDRLDATSAVPLARSEALLHPRTGRRLVTRCILLTGGFVPRGALLPDGRPHPAAGTGFVFGVHGACLADPQPQRAEGEDSYGYRELIQLRFDGQTLRVTDRLKTPGDDLAPGFLSLSHGLSNAIPDGADLLTGVSAGPVEPGAAPSSPSIPTKHPHATALLGRNYGACFCRWKFGEKGWRPAEVIPVSGADLAMEPSLIRDADGTLLMAVRGKGLAEPPGAVHDGLENTYEHFRVYRSTDTGKTWQRVIHLPRMRNATPVVLNRSAGGHPFIMANPYQSGRDPRGRVLPSTHWRNRLCLWPVTADRTGVKAPLVVLDANARFGLPRAWNDPAMHADNIWYLDHPLASVVRLADGQWHCLFGFRVSDMAVNAAGAPPTERAGFWTGEVRVDGETSAPTWSFASC